jgi:hypothetical protein
LDILRQEWAVTETHSFNQKETIMVIGSFLKSGFTADSFAGHANIQGPQVQGPKPAEGEQVKQRAVRTKTPSM